MTIWEPIKPVWEAFGDWLGKFWEKIKAPFKAVGGLWDKLWGKKDAPELSIPEMQPVGDALKTPLSVTPKTVENKTQKNSYNINGQASPNQNSKEVADEVMRRLRRNHEAPSMILWGPCHDACFRAVSVFVKHQCLSNLKAQ